MSDDSSKNSTAPTREIEIRVRYAETDQMGVVYHANYLVWCEMGRTDFIRDLGLSYAAMERSGVSLAVSELSARYHAPARYDDLIRVRTTLVDVRSRMIVFDYRITNADPEGRYTIEKDKFTEIIEYVSGQGVPESFVGSSFDFTVKMDGDTFTKVGTIKVSGQDYKIDEKWERCKP